MWFQIHSTIPAAGLRRGTTMPAQTVYVNELAFPYICVSSVIISMNLSTFCS